MSHGQIPTGPTPEARTLLRATAALLFGLPLALLMAVPGAMSQWFHMFFILVVQDLVTRGFWLLDMLPTLGSMALLGYGVFGLGRINRDDPAWQSSVFHTRLTAILLCGMAPYLMWRDWIPHEDVFLFGAQTFAFVACVFVIQLNFILYRLARSLPNPVLESDTRMFSRLNLAMLMFILLLVVGYLAASRMQWFTTPGLLANLIETIDHQGSLLLTLLMLPSVATTLSMIWKTRQTVMTMVFDPSSLPPSPVVDEELIADEDEEGDEVEEEEDDPVSVPIDTNYPADAARAPDPE